MLRDGPEFGSFLVLVSSLVIELRRCFLGLLLDCVKELQESFCISLEHIFGTSQTIFTHCGVLGKSFDFFLFSFKHLLDQKHLPLFLDELPPILSIFGPFDRDCEARSFGYIDLALHLWVNG